MALAARATAPPPALDRARRGTLVAILFALVTAAFEGTVVTSAMPVLAQQLGRWPIYPWAFTAFLAASMVGVLLCGRLADRLGRRPVFLGGALAFTAASLACALAPTGLALVLLRAAQGFFAGALQPVALTISADLFTVDERARVQGLYTSAWGAGNLLGPPLGALLATRLSWRWAFLVSVPTALVAAALLARSFREAPRGPEREPAPLAGAWFAGLACSAALVALDAREGGLSSPRARLAAGLFALALAGLFARYEARAAAPLLPAPLSANAHVRAGLLTGVFAGALLSGCVAYVPLWLVQQGVGVVRAGSALVPLLVGWAAGSTFGVRAMVRFGLRRTASGGFALALAGAALLLLSARLGFAPGALGALALLGAGVGPAASIGLVAAQAHTPHAQRGAVTSAVFATRALGGALCVAALGLTHAGSTRFAALAALALAAALACARALPARV